MSQSGHTSQEQQQQQQPPSPPSSASTPDTHLSNTTSSPITITTSSPGLSAATSVPSPQSQLQSPLAAATSSPSLSSSSSASFDSSRPASQHSSLTSASPASLATADSTRKEEKEELLHIKLPATPESHSAGSEHFNGDSEQGKENKHENGDANSPTTTITAPSSPIPSSATTVQPQQLPPPPLPPTGSPSKSKPRHPAGIKSPFFHRTQAWLLQRQWFGHSLGLATLVATLVGLLVFGYRSYKLDIYNSHMSYLQVCLGQAQANRNLDSACQASVAQPVPPSPYRLIGRDFHATGYVSAGIIGKRQRASVWGRPSGYSFMSTGNEAFDESLAVVALLIPSLFLVISLGHAIVFLLRCLREPSQVQESHATSVRNEVHITRHHPEQGDAITSELGVRVVKHKPEEHQYLGQLRENLRHVLERNPSEEKALGYLRRRKWKSVQEHDDDDDEDDGSRVSWSSSPDWGLGSESTLVSGWDKDRSGRRLSSVTIKSNMDAEGEGQQYEGLIELKTKGKNKTFFDPKTGEFIRLTPWKASAATDGDDGRIHGDEKGDSMKALARMGVGAVALGGGKSLDEEILEELDRSDLLRIADLGQVPRAGDTITGLLTNECPTGKPNII